MKWVKTFGCANQLKFNSANCSHFTVCETHKVIYVNFVWSEMWNFLNQVYRPYGKSYFVACNRVNNNTRWNHHISFIMWNIWNNIYVIFVWYEMRIFQNQVYRSYKMPSFLVGSKAKSSHIIDCQTCQAISAFK